MSRPRPSPPRPALIGWFAAMGMGGFAFGLLAEARPFGDDVLAHPLVVYFLLVGAGLLVLRVVLARPVPDVLPERVLLAGTFAGLAMFLAGNFVAVHLPALIGDDRFTPAALPAAAPHGRDAPALTGLQG